jgi:hypothetical protein
VSGPFRGEGHKEFFGDGAADVEAALPDLQGLGENDKITPGRKTFGQEFGDLVQRRRKIRMVGVGLDGGDSHIRQTRGENFHLVGGSHETHEGMQEKCIKFNEKLSRRGKQLDDLEAGEFLALAEECEMNVISPRRRGPGKD